MPEPARKNMDSFNGISCNNRSMDSCSSAFLTLREFLKHPAMVGTAFPASAFLVRRMLAPVAWERISVFVEYGPGTGRFTQAALARLPAHATLIALDMNENFTRHLRRHIDDPRLRVVTGSAGDIRDIMHRQGFARADYILSGIPFSGISDAMAAHIMAASAAILQPDGHFLAYQMRTTIENHMLSRFGVVEKAFGWRNIPPCHLYWASAPIARTIGAAVEG